MSNKLIPFGKYKNQPVEVLLQDQRYCDWLTSQEWFREKFPQIHLTVINMGAEPQDSPEHNKMQARLLSNTYMWQLIVTALSPIKWIKDNPGVNWEISGKKFEDKGWDFSCFVELERPRKDETEEQWEKMGNHHDNDRYIDVAVKVEAKPTLGDDYPSVIRTVRQRLGDRREGRFSSKGVIWFDEYTGCVPLRDVQNMCPDIAFVLTSNFISTEQLKSELEKARVARSLKV